MPSQRVPLLLFSGTNQLTSSYFRTLQGLTVTGPASADSQAFLRHARGLHETCLNELKPAPGNTLLYAIPNIHSITRFNDQRFFAADGILYKNGVGVLYIFDGSRLTLTRMPPGNTQPDQLFIAGGGAGRKIDMSGVATQWGIAPPNDGFTVALATQLVKDIEFFSFSSDWAIMSGAIVLNDELVIVQDGTSLLVYVPASTLGIIQKMTSITLDLSMFTTPGDSSDEDFIELWARVDEDQRGFDSFTLRFDVADGNFASDYYQFKFLPTSLTENTGILHGIGETITDPAVFIGNSGGSEDSAGEADGGTGTGASTGESDGVATASATWSRLRVPKGNFLRSGSGPGTWADVVAIQIMIQTNALSNLLIYFDFMRMLGGAGMYGNYKSLVTFENTLTGARSNSNPTPVVTLQNDRQRLTYTNIPFSLDPQVNARTLWRTLGGGGAFFREHVIPDNGTTAYSSRVADFVGLWSTAQSEVLFLPELPTDNAMPEDTHIDFIYDQATVFWLSGATGKKGRIYYSPPGRPEGQRGFIQVCQDDTPLLRLVVYNRARYAVGEAGWYRVDGTEPYTSFKFAGIPGINAAQARTLAQVPQGLMWQAQDGLRIFNGSQSELVQFDRIGPLFRGQHLEQLFAMQGICAAYAREQYFISDGEQTLSFNLSTGFIRDLGQGFTSLYYEEDTRLLIGGTSAGLVIVEDITQPPTQRCSWQTTAVYSAPGQTSTVQRLYIDADTDGQPITVTIIVNGHERQLPPMVLAERSVSEYALGVKYQSFSVRLSFQPTPNIRVYQIYADIYSPPGDQR